MRREPSARPAALRLGASGVPRARPASTAAAPRPSPRPADRPAGFRGASHPPPGRNPRRTPAPASGSGPPPQRRRRLRGGWRVRAACLGAGRGSPERRAAGPGRRGGSQAGLFRRCCHSRTGPSHQGASAWRGCVSAPPPAPHPPRPAEAAGRSSVAGSGRASRSCTAGHSGPRLLCGMRGMNPAVSQCWARCGLFLTSQLKCRLKSEGLNRSEITCVEKDEVIHYVFPKQEKKSAFISFKITAEAWGTASSV